MDTTQYQSISTSISTAPPGKSTSTAMDHFVLHTKSLYSLPVVAAEVLELTASPQVDNVALKECIERDPALTVRILRVVNSSLFGLSHPVSNLSQAITMLGIKPLKLLVLGFSLPENLFANIARNQLEWYWSTTLVRAVAAREISEQWFQRPGDEAFLTGLLQDIGMLALIGQFRETYTRLMSRAMDSEVDLVQIESESLGFDHLELSAALLQQWKMPVQLGRAIANIRKSQIHACDETSADHLTRVLQLATLVGELVGQHRLSALPGLLELGEAYCELDKPRLREFIAELQPKVEQLAEVLSLDLPGEQVYTDILVAAHLQISELVAEEEGTFSENAIRAEDINTQVLREANRLRFAVKAFLRGAPAKQPTVPQQVKAVPPEQIERKSAEEASGIPFAFGNSFKERLVVELGKCRSERQALSVVMLDVTMDNSEYELNQALVSSLLDMACREEFNFSKEAEECSPTQRILVLTGCDRQETVCVARGAIHAIETSFREHNLLNPKERIRVSVGVASVVLASKNFDATRLLQTAERCLAGARTCGTSSVKSLEIY